MAALDPNPPNGYNDVVMIGIDKDKNSEHAFKWALDNLVMVKPRRPVLLVHVRTQSLNSNPVVDPRIGHTPIEEEMHQLFLPYRGFCARKGIDAKEVVLHDIEVSNALIEYITTNLIGCIVVGASNRNILTRKLKGVDTPTHLGKLAPEYCAVYVVAKAKVHSIRTMESRTTSVSGSATPTSMHGPKSPGVSASSLASKDTLNNRMSMPRLSSFLSPLHQLMQHIPSLHESTNHSWLSTSSDNSSYHSNRISIDRMSGGESMHSTCPSPKKLMKIPEHQKSTVQKIKDSAPNGFSYRGSLGSLPIESNRYSASQTSQSTFSTSSSSSTICTQDPEVEMERLKLQLQHNMEALRLFENEAHPTQKTAKELGASQSNKFELERCKQKAAMEVAYLSDQLATMENHTRNIKNVIQYKKYTLEDIEAATDYFSASLKVGEGGYGPVYRGKLDDKQVAIKVLRPDVSQGLSQFQKEVEVLGRMKHPNLVLLLGACPEYGCLVYELMNYGSLEDRLFRKDNTPPIPWRIRFKIAAEIASALHFLHSTKPEPLVHRDLKPANILLDQNYVPKICDVGLARLVPTSTAENMTQCHMTAAAGTFFYIDPEYQQTGMLSVKSDVYSLGVVFLQILTGRSAMGLSHAVENAIEEGNFAEVLDPTVEGWPIEEALSFARMALKCCEMRKRDRPDLGSEVLPEMTRLSAYAMSATSSSFSLMGYEESLYTSSSPGSTRMSQVESIP